MNGITCQEADQQDLAARYLARTLAPEVEADYEVHFLGCERCREELRLATAVRSALVEAPVQVASRSRALVRKPGVRWAMGAGALAAGLAAVFLSGPDRSTRELQDLGQVSQAPVYLGVEVRSPEGAGASLFDAGMRTYAGEAWGSAARELERAAAEGSDPVPTYFFLGAALLMADRPREAAVALGRVTAAGESPYLGEARYYRAKALLRAGRAEDALADLRTLAASSHDLAADAAELAGRVEEVRQR